MTPIDAEGKWIKASREDPTELLKKMTMSFILLLSRQPNMVVEFSEKALRTFPYDNFNLTAVNDDDGSVTFMLVDTTQEVH